MFLQDDGTYDGFCYSCHTFVKHPYADKEEGYEPPKPVVKTPEQIEKELKYFQTLPIEDDKVRRITKETLEYFGVRLGFDQETASTVHAHYYPYEESGQVKSFKVKILENGKIFTVGDFANCEPFGWRQALKAGGKKLFITEGEKDAMALFQVLRARGKAGRDPAVISLPNGTKSVSKLSRYLKSFSKWKEVVICFDNDDSGNKAVNEFTKMYPSALVATLPLNDVHDMVMADREQELFTACIFDAKTKLSDKLVRSSSVWDQARQRPGWGLSWPWDALTQITRGIRRREGYYFGAGVKMG